VTARLGHLSGEQLRRSGQIQLHHRPLTAEQAHMLLAALTSTTDAAGYLEQRAVHPHAERELKRAGLVEAENRSHRPRVEQDVRYSLRYFDFPRDDHGQPGCPVGDERDELLGCDTAGCPDGVDAGLEPLGGLGVAGVGPLRQVSRCLVLDEPVSGFGECDDRLACGPEVVAGQGLIHRGGQGCGLFA
jgi:hypothetical protein